MNAEVGHNMPPGSIDLGKAAMADLSAWLAENPVIENGAQAEQGKLFFDRTRSTLDDIEAERVQLVTPLNTKLADINDQFKSHHNTDPKRPGIFDRIFSELKARLTAFAQAEEEKRLRIAEEARQRAEEAERVAREAEQREQNIKADAAVGEIGANVGEAIAEADSAFADYGKASREAVRAERDVNVRVGGGFSGRALSMRTKETLVLTSYAKAIKAIGPNEKIEAAILLAARDYRKLKGALPDGVIAETTREI
jgi:hypothetical protein